MTTIYIVRHGESEENLLYEKGQAYTIPWSELGSDLSKHGIHQVKKLANVLKKIRFDAVFSSDYIRAKHTADIIALEKHLAVQASKKIRERSMGKLDSIKKNDLLWKETHSLLHTLSHKKTLAYKPFPDAESMEDASSRLITFLSEISIVYQNKTILVVCHGNLMHATIIKLGFSTMHDLPHASIYNTGYFIVETDGIEFFFKGSFGIHKHQ